MKDKNAKYKILSYYQDLFTEICDIDYSYYERNNANLNAIEEFIKNNTFCYGYYKLTKTQRGFCDFIIIASILMGFISITVNILILVGVVPSTTDLFFTISSLIVTSICIFYLLIVKVFRIYKNGKLRNKDKVH